MSVNTLKPQNPQRLLAKIADKCGLEKSEILYLQNAITAANVILNPDGSIKGQANISGRTEPLSTTTANIDNTGNLASLANVNTRTTDLLVDGTGTPLTGGKRGAIALDVNNRLANSFRNTGVNVSNVPTSATTMSNDGVATAIPISAYSSQFPAGLVSYNSGSIDPGSFGKVYVFFDDPTFAGGAIAYAFSANAQDQTAAEGRQQAGAFTTVNGVAKTGGGKTGGTGGSAGGRGFNQ